MRVLITGADGQIGRALAAASPAGAEVILRARAQLDLTRDADVAAAVREVRPDLVVNAAGYTGVDRAEAEPDVAHAVNAAGAGRLAAAAADVGARMIHFSTDYVFDGTGMRPYRPGDPPRPLNVYGASKLAGEREVLGSLPGRALVIRTAWIYAARGQNFLLTMLRLMKERDRVGVVSDQIGSPTCAASVAAATWRLAARPDVQGIAHWTDDGTASWYDFALAIRQDAMEAGLLDSPAEVVPVATSEYPTPACRPRFTVLDCSETRAALGLAPDHWRVALKRTLRELAGG